MQVRVASFNLENLDGGEGSELRCSLLQPQLARLSADILCLQEIDATQAEGSDVRVLAGLEQLLADTQYAGFHKASTHRRDGDGPRDRHNLVVLSRWPILRTMQVQNDLVSPPGYVFATTDPPGMRADVSWDRPLLHVEIGLESGHTLNILNMHLKAPLAAAVPGRKIGPFSWASVPAWAEGYYIAAIKRAGQAFEARLVIDRIFDADASALLAVCGDFNAVESEVPVRILIGDTEDTGNGALTGRELISLERSLPGFRRFTVIHGGRRQMLDHILVSRALLGGFRTVEIHNEALGDELVGYTLVQGSPESYHAPVVAMFDIGNSSPAG